MNRKSIWVVAIVVAVVTFVWVSVLISLTPFVIWKSTQNQSRSNTDESHVYRYLKVDPLKNERSRGFTSFSSRIEDENEGGYISYQGKDGSYFLISNFDTEEYCCTGSCYCADPSNFRKSAVSSIPAVRSLFYLVAAVSSAVAYQRAKEYFKDECTTELQDSCDSTSVISEIQDCECGCSDGGCGTETVKEEKEKKREVVRTYTCKGKCLARNRLKDLRKMEDVAPADHLKVFRDNAQELQKATDAFGCEKLELTKDLTEYFPKGPEFWAKSEISEPQAMALKFTEEELLSFCEENSFKEVDFNFHGTMKKVEQQMCLGRDESPINPTVYCVLK